MSAGGYRGYVAARPVQGSRVPQHVQNLVIRDYAQRHALAYKLSGTEYAMPGCYMMLADLLDELPALDGIIAYTIFMLPEARERRRTVYRRVIEAGKSLHGAVEGLCVASWDDAQRIEDIWLVQQALDRRPAEA
ncbi:MAG TPA: LIC12192 family sporadic carbohydrate cluster protein [Aliidongia sp.]|nr:LIC12192 family sporadic carbohydrate cluster protein [Aliidongia sp.]